MKITHRCPECQTFLSSMPLADGIALACRACGGVSVDVAVLKRHATHQIVQALWSGARDSGRASARPCPACEQALRTFATTGEGEQIDLDACAQCQLLWFDGQELERMGVQLRPPSANLSDARNSQLLREGAKYKTSAEFVRFLMADVHLYFHRPW